MARPSSQGDLNKKKDVSPSQLILRKLIGGTVGGFCQAVCSHPLDTIKSRVQAGLFPSASAAARDTYSREGLRGFYKGVVPPIVIMGAYNAALFSCNQFARNALRPDASTADEPLSLPRVALAGFVAAPISAAVINPAEVIKVRLQLQTQSGAEAKYRGVLDCLVKTVRTEGVRALYVGYGATFTTRAVGLPFYFVLNEMTREYLQPTPTGGPRPTPSTTTALASGTMAGLGFWGACYPADLIKTKLQSAPRGSLSATTVIKDALATSGPLGLYRGFGACMLRSTPANGSVWLGMETTVDYLERNGW